MSLVVPIGLAFAVVLAQYKGLVDVAEFGLPENYLYVGGFALIFVALVPLLVVWRCPSCRAYLGREMNPARCPACGARFR